VKENKTKSAKKTSHVRPELKREKTKKSCSNFLFFIKRKAFQFVFGQDFKVSFSKKTGEKRFRKVCP
jgi:hypothetical protein